MTMELDVFVGNTTIMDEEVYQLWLDGYTGMSQTCSRNVGFIALASNI